MDLNEVGSLEEMQAKQQQMMEIQEQRAMILDQILEPGAKDRLARLALTRKDKARVMEDSLISAAKNGRLKSKVSEEYLIQMLESYSSGESVDSKGKKSVVVQRRKYGMDDEEEDNDDDV